MMRKLLRRSTSRQIRIIPPALFLVAVPRSPVVVIVQNLAAVRSSLVLRTNVLRFTLNKKSFAWILRTTNWMWLLQISQVQTCKFLTWRVTWSKRFGLTLELITLLSWARRGRADQRMMSASRRRCSRATWLQCLRPSCLRKVLQWPWGFRCNHP